MSEMDAADLLDLILAKAQATFTITSKKTGKSFTFRVRNKGDDAPWFVDMLTGPNNNTDYTWLGTVFSGPHGVRYHQGSRSRIAPDAPGAVAWQWFFDKAVTRDSKALALVEVDVSCTCVVCGGRLTRPESIRRQMGDDCATRREKN